MISARNIDAFFLADFSQSHATFRIVMMGISDRSRSVFHFVREKFSLGHCEKTFMFFAKNIPKNAIEINMTSDGKTDSQTLDKRRYHRENRQ